MDNPLSDRKSQLSAAKQALLARRLQGQRGTRTAIPRRSPDQPVPLSFSQQRLWFLYQLEPDNPVYNVPFALHLQGNLDLSALQRAWQTLAQRHEILRTTFTQSATEPRLRQVIHPETGIALSPVELTHLGQSVWAEVRRLAHKEALQPFDLRQGPLWRVTLLRLAEQEFVLLVTLHHIISDVWSTGVLVREMTTLYYAFAQAKPNPLAPLPIQYGDFSLWQRQSLQGERLETLLNYWQSQFATLPPTLQLPTDRSRPSVQSFRGDRRQFWLSAELTTALKRLGQNAEATLFMVLLAAFKTLLYRYSGQTDLTVGSPIANRNQAAIEGLIGLFMNTLALRTQL
ncbi:MAG: condensation domain-containing protein, partial [Cyanobacteria bacterium P01_C01_bin.73]